MFKRTKPCLYKETNGSYSNAVIGILCITISLSMGLSVLGVWFNAFDGFQEDNFEMPLIPEKKPLEDIISQDTSSEFKISGDQSTEVNSVRVSSEHSEDIFSDEAISGLCDVSVPEKGLFEGFDTEAGEMVIDDLLLPAEPLPLKLTDAYLDGSYIIVGTLGGYSWVDGCIKVIQTKSDDRFIWDNIQGYIDITSTELVDYGLHGWDYYNLTFTVRGNHPIILDANHVPDSPLGDFWVEDCDENLDKFVTLKICTTWTGCENINQQFMVILAHKVLSQNPKLPIFKTSPVRS